MVRNISIKLSQDKRSCCDNRTTTCCIQNRSIQNPGSLFLEYDISSYLWKQGAGVWFFVKKALNEAIQRHLPRKWRYVCANQTPFVNKEINKKIMKWLWLRNNSLNTTFGDSKVQKLTLLYTTLISFLCKKEISSVYTEQGDISKLWRDRRLYQTPKREDLWLKENMSSKGISFLNILCVFSIIACF